MVQTVSGNYLAIAQCVQKQMYRDMDQVSWTPMLMDFEEEKTAEIKTTANTGIGISTAVNQKFEQDGDLVRMTYLVPGSLNMTNDREKMQSRWNICTKRG